MRPDRGEPPGSSGRWTNLLFDKRPAQTLAGRRAGVNYLFNSRTAGTGRRCAIGGGGRSPSPGAPGIDRLGNVLASRLGRQAESGGIRWHTAGVERGPRGAHNLGVIGRVSLPASLHFRLGRSLALPERLIWFAPLKATVACPS